MKVTMYCLFNPKGEMMPSHLNYYRKRIEENWLMFCSDENWGNWYRKGWRIKKVSVVLTLNQPQVKPN